MKQSCETGGPLRVAVWQGPEGLPVGTLDGPFSAVVKPIIASEYMD